MNADPNRVTQTDDARSRPQPFHHAADRLFLRRADYPNCVLANTEPYSGWTVEALILMPLGFYMMERGAEPFPA